MFFKSVLCTAFVVLVDSCSNEGKTSAEISPDSGKTIAASRLTRDTLATGCYSMIASRDSSFMQINSKGSLITGSLSYNFFQKDRNDGTVQAELNGDVLSGWYLFRSEGVMSVRQVAWKIKGTELWPATGEMMERGDTMMFVDEGKIRFDSAHVFKKVACTL
jgi:hypothetical protein